MRNMYVLLIGLLGLVAQTVTGAETFEGQYDMAFNGEGENIRMTFWTKGGHVRMKVGAGGQMGEMIMRNGMSSMIMIMPQQRMYMEMDIPQDAIKADFDPSKEHELPFKKTGKSKKILGYTAHEFLFEDGPDKMTIWATDELGAMAFANNPMMEGWSSAMRQMTGLKSFFPLETIGYENGKETFRMTVENLEKKTLPESLFLPPEGYMKMTLPAGMGGFMPGR